MFTCKFTSPRSVDSRLFALTAISAGMLTAAGCPHNASIDPQNAKQAAVLELAKPKAIEIQPYLTKPVRLEGEGPADGIEIIVAVLDRFDDEMKVVGTFNFELYTRRMASADRRDKRVGHWEPVEIDTAQAQQTYWHRPSRYYRFWLKLEDPPLPAGRYILNAWYVSPWDRKLFDEYEFTHEPHVQTGKDSTP